MYRIFCESYQNFINSFDENNYRLEVAKPLELMANINKYAEEEKKQSELFKFRRTNKINQFIFKISLLVLI